MEHDSRHRRRGHARLDGVDEAEQAEPARLLTATFPEPARLSAVLAVGDTASRSAITGALQQSIGNRAVQGLLAPPAPKVNAALQRQPRGSVRPGNDEASGEEVLRPLRSGTTIEQFQLVHQVVHELAAEGSIVPPAPRAEFEESRESMHALADACHGIDEHWRREATRGLGTNKWFLEFAEEAARDVEVYEQFAVDVQLAETSTIGWWGMFEMSESSWARLATNAQQNGIDLELMPVADTDIAVPGSEEKKLDERAMGARAQALKSMVSSAGDDVGYLQGSDMQGAANQYRNSWKAVATAQGLAVGSLVNDRRTANRRKADAAEETMDDIEAVIEFVDDVEKAARTFANAQASMARREIPEVLTPSAVVRFVMSEEIDKCVAAIDTVDDHEDAFKAVIGNTESVAKTSAFKDTLEQFKIDAARLDAEANQMRQAHLQFGSDVDAGMRAQGRLGRGREQAEGAMMDLALLRECTTHTTMAHRAADEVLNHVRALRDGIGEVYFTERGNRLLTGVAGSRRLAAERRRYELAARAIHTLQRRLLRRDRHVRGLTGRFVNAVGPRGSSTGANTW